MWEEMHFQTTFNNGGLSLSTSLLSIFYYDFPLCSSLLMQSNWFHRWLSIHTAHTFPSHLIGLYLSKRITVCIWRDLAAQTPATLEIAKVVGWWHTSIGASCRCSHFLPLTGLGLGWHWACCAKPTRPSAFGLLPNFAQLQYCRWSVIITVMQGRYSCEMKPWRWHLYEIWLFSH